MKNTIQDPLELYVQLDTNITIDKHAGNGNYKLVDLAVAIELKEKYETCAQVHNELRDYLELTTGQTVKGKIVELQKENESLKFYWSEQYAAHVERLESKLTEQGWRNTLK